ncbi:MAG: hypothetical protein AABN95_26865 [Acidobacteriota bacterium]
MTTNVPAATFNITGSSNYSGGGTLFSVNDAPPGPYAITYGPVAGYLTPAPETQTLNAGGAIFFAGTYSLTTGSIAVTMNLPTAGFSITGPINYSGSGSTSLNDAPLGAYTITYGAVAGYLTPLPETRTLVAGGAITFLGNYVSRSAGLKVSGQRLSGLEERHVLFVATNVLPQLIGGTAERIRVASRAAWWGLKEGTFSLPNPHVFSSCSQLQPNGKAKDVRLGPLEICSASRAWQVGLSGVQVPNFTDHEVLQAVEALWPGRPIEAVLAEAAQLAGFDPNQGDGADIVNSTGVLRKSWLLRHPVVGLTLVERDVTTECIEGARSWCYATGYSKPWPQITKYAPTREAALQSVADLATLFGGFLR